jgi:hypothetical protein
VQHVKRPEEHRPVPGLFGHTHGLSGHVPSKSMIKRPADSAGDLAVHELNCSIYERFREKGIVIPFPRRDVHIHEGQRSQRLHSSGLCAARRFVTAGDVMASTYFISTTWTSKFSVLPASGWLKSMSTVSFFTSLIFTGMRRPSFPCANRIIPAFGVTSAGNCFLGTS